MSVDTEKLRKAIQRFEDDSRPSSFSETRPATLADLNKVRNSVVTALRAFVDELEKK